MKSDDYMLVLLGKPQAGNTMQIVVSMQVVAGALGEDGDKAVHRTCGIPGSQR